MTPASWSFTGVDADTFSQRQEGVRAQQETRLIPLSLRWPMRPLQDKQSCWRNLAWWRREQPRTCICIPEILRSETDEA